MGVMFDFKIHSNVGIWKQGLLGTMVLISTTSCYLSPKKVDVNSMQVNAVAGEALEVVLPLAAETRALEASADDKGVLLGFKRVYSVDGEQQTLLVGNVVKPETVITLKISDGSVKTLKVNLLK